MYTTTAEKCSNAAEDNEPNFEGSEWDLIRADAWKEDSEIEDNQKSEIKSELCKGIDVMAEKLKEIVQFDDPQITTGVSKFLRRFNKLSIPRSHSKLATALHQFGWELGNTTTTQAGQIRFGKRIAVQATAAGRRKKGKTKGNGKEIAGRPLKCLKNLSNVPSSSTDSRYCMPTRKEPKGKRLHSLIKNINCGQQNAGKW